LFKFCLPLCSTTYKYFLSLANTIAYLADVFNGIEWSSNLVFAKTVEKLHLAEKSFSKLPILYDIDTIHDLKAVFPEMSANHLESAKYLLDKDGIIND
jgi:glycosyltransferase A (GT-A) superfamily protein (DUF2064 family)